MSYNLTYTKKWAEDIQMVDRHEKRSSPSLIIRKMQVKSTVRYGLTPVRMAIINKSTNKKLVRVEKGEPSCTVGGIAN